MTQASAIEARAAADLAARASYGRLVALLARQWRDLAAAEDALAEAFRAALERWPLDGVPARPEAWLLTAARRVLIDQSRAGRVRTDAEPTLALLSEQFSMTEPSLFPDDRLKLLFVCAHPAIDASARTPLMLQTVLGLDAARIAAAFLTSPAALGQRLVRAKAKIRDAGIAFETPERGELPARLDAVLQAIYAAFGSGWEDVAGADPKRRGLAREAIWLARLVTALMPDEPEARGLLALMLHSDARRMARRDATRRAASFRSASRTRRCGPRPRSPRPRPNSAGPRAAGGSDRFSSRPRSSRSMPPARRRAAPTGRPWRSSMKAWRGWRRQPAS
jgi:RNA polymerase sigma-70 factor (ECF subfamily)